MLPAIVRRESQDRNSCERKIHGSEMGRVPVILFTNFTILLPVNPAEHPPLKSGMSNLLPSDVEHDPQDIDPSCNSTHRSKRKVRR